MLWRDGGLGVKAKKMMYKGVVVPTAIYRAEMWNLREAERRKLDVFEMKCLRSMCILTSWNRVRKEKAEEESTGGKAVIW